jgi:hypothetical protein
MNLTFLPLLQVQRDLYALPRGMERFREYIRTMTDPETGDLALPLVAMNPMGKDHIPALIDDYVALDAERIAADAMAEAGGSKDPPLPPGRRGGSLDPPGRRGGSLDPPGRRGGSLDPPGRRGGSSDPPAFKVGLVVSDDLKGGWTNRYASEFNHRIEGGAITRRGFITAILWTSEPASAQAVREAVLMAIYRAHYLHTHAAAKTLGEMLAQEGYAAAMAGCTTPALDADDLEYTRTVIAPYLQATDRATVIACLFGDEAADALGYRRLGLTARAGFALALSDASLLAAPLPDFR